MFDRCTNTSMGHVFVFSCLRACDLYMRAYEGTASVCEGHTSLQYFMRMCLSRLHLVVSALTPSIVI